MPQSEQSTDMATRKNSVTITDFDTIEIEPNTNRNDTQNGTKEQSKPNRNVKSVFLNVDSDTKKSCVKDAEQNGEADGRTGHRPSIMEMECAQERNRLTLLKQCSTILKHGDQRYTKESLHRTLQDEGLLERIFRTFDVQSRNYLVQQEWIEYLKERLAGDKHMEFIEQVECVAYVLCGNGVINLDAFQKILQNKVVTNKLFRFVDKDGDGYATAEEIMEFLSTVTSSRPRVGFDKHSVDRLEELFRETVGDQKEITREQFKKIVVSKNPFFTERVFQIFDEDDSGAISLQEFIAAVHRFAGQTPDDKIRFLFKVYDLDGDGLIQPGELQHVMHACMEENGMQFSDEQLQDLTGAMFEDADAECRGAITYEALKKQISSHEGLLENLSISIDRWLVPPKEEKIKKSFLQRLSDLKPYQLSAPYLKNNQVFLTYLGLFFAVNIGLFVSRAWQYRQSNYYTIFARACGQCLNFNCAWILVLMLRSCLTQLRVRGFSSYMPLDNHIYLHKLTGVMICIYSLVHTLMHLLNFSLVIVKDPVINKANFTLYEWLLTDRPGVFGLIGGVANPTGVALAVILLVMYVCSQPFIRRGGSFEIFYWTHLLYIPFWILVIFHGPNFWKWFVLPGFMYLVERIMRLSWMRSKQGRTYISSGILLPSKVTHLVVKRPPLFDYHAGDYVFVNIPAIATYEWHPFTISSAPEQEDYLWLHIRGVGEWTNGLYSYFEREQARLQCGEVLEPAENTIQKLCRSLSVHSRSRKGSNASKKRSVDFSPQGCTNDAFVDVELRNKKYNGAHLGPEVSFNPGLQPPSRTLEKAKSMPDVQKNLKKKQRNIALKTFMRSESERNLCEEQRCTQIGNYGVVSRIPQNKSLVHSFRYMRTKPTIIPLETPHCEERRSSIESILTIARRFSKPLSPDRDVEATPDVKTVATVKEESEDDQVFDPPTPIGKPLKIYLDGPYGAPSSHIFLAEHATLIAAGIGVTPFASILQSVMHRYWSERHQCPRCQHTWADDMPRHNMNLKKVDFFWINREQRSFEWFVSLLSQLEIEQAELGGAMDRFLEMHMYITSALQSSDMKAVGLQLALDLLHEKGKRDLITGLKTRTNAGRPNWDKVFKQLQEQKKGKVTVFYCGPAQLAKLLRVKCDQYGFGFRKEVF